LIQIAVSNLFGFFILSGQKHPKRKAGYAFEFSLRTGFEKGGFGRFGCDFGGVRIIEKIKKYKKWLGI
jgi:hypothetical protein